MGRGEQRALTAHEAKRLADEHLRAEGSSLVAKHASRNRRYGVWQVDYRDPERPEQMLVGGGLVVTDAGVVYDVGSAPGSLEDLMQTLGEWPDQEPVDRAGRRCEPVLDTDAESLMLLAAEDPLEADGLAAWTAARRPWPGVLDEERAKPYFRDVLRFVTAERAKRRGDVYPADSEVFAAFHLTPFDAVKVVILGQDPYPNPGQAMGLSFSVPRGVRLPTSLVNIHAAMRAEGLTPPEHGDLTGWARQGVFMLNTALTVPRGAAGKHLVAWRPFTDAVIRILSAREQPIVFVLWGAKAQRVLRRELINTDSHGVVVAPHPAARAAAQTRFRQAQTFTQVNGMLRDLGNKTVDWTDV